MNVWNENILYEIISYFDKLIDVINLASTCKSFYNEILNNNINLWLKKYEMKELPTSLPKYFSHLKCLNLNILNLKTRTTFDFSKLKTCTSLEDLQIVNGDIYNLNISTIKPLKNLKKLYLICTIYELPASFAPLEDSLEELFISGTFVMDEQIKCLKKLKYLNVSFCKNLKGYCLQKFTNLTKLNMEGTKINSKYLAKLTQLEHLRISNVNCGEYLTKLINLKTLSIYDALPLKRCDLYKLPKLEKLNIRMKHSVSSSYIYEDFKLPQTLKHLKLCNSNINDNHLQNLTNLETLNVSYCEEFKGSCLQNMKQLKKLECCYSSINDYNLQYCYQLPYLNLQGCYKVEGKGLLNLINLTHLEIGKYHNCKNLEILSEINDCHLQKLINLQYLKLDWCENINGDCFKYLLNLKTLHCEYCENINGENLKLLPNLINLSIGEKVGEEILKELKQLKTLTLCNESGDMEILFTGKCLQYLEQLKEFTYRYMYPQIFNGDNLRHLKQELQKGVIFEDLIDTNLYFD